ncbi:MAG TPA: hypothetical protein VEO95_04345 [Chthoniobacteraceae bacterium]|nr:hypothetical protein [Chthoniobacteraceae bacterium]
MSLLYVVSESDGDAFFYALCAKKFTGCAFTLSVMKNRKGDGVDAVTRQLKSALILARAAAGGAETVCFIGAMDNDRAPHEENIALVRARLVPKEQARENRIAWMLETVEGVLGQNREAWPLHVALAVPVEMIESWIVRARREAEPQPTPHFSNENSNRAGHYYAPSAPPPQWKDLAAEEQKQCGHMDRLTFYEHVVRELDAGALAGRSLSFRMFKEWLDAWPRAMALA